MMAHWNRNKTEKWYDFWYEGCIIFIMNSYTKYTLKMRKEKIKTFKSYTICTITSHHINLSSTQQSNHSLNVCVREVFTL